MARIIDAFTQFFDNAGDPLVKGKLKFLESGTNNTDKPTFKDSAMTIPNTNPVILDGDGSCPSVFGSGVYNVILFTSDNVQIRQFDPVGSSSSGAQFDIWDASQVYDIPDIVRGSNGEYYESFINSNSNNNPTVSPSQWDLITIVKSYIADASGSPDVITADFTPNIHSLVNNTRVLITATAANTTTAPTFAPDGLTAKAIVKNGNDPLSDGDMKGSADMVYQSNIDKWELLNPAGSMPKPSSSVDNNITVFDANNEVKDSGVQFVRTGNAAGPADVLTVAFAIPVTVITDKLETRVRALLANATTTPTINYDELGAKTIVKNGNQPLDINDIGVGQELILVSNTGNDNVELLNPQKQSSASFTSAQQAITSGGQLVIAHGLSSEPFDVSAIIVCTTAEGGYSIGDRLNVNIGVNNSGATFNRGISTKIDSTNITIRFGSNVNAFSVVRADNGGDHGAVNTNWQLVIKANL